MDEKKVLVLDDDEYCELLIGTILKGITQIEKYIIYSNGWDTLDYLRTCSKSTFPDLLFVDLNMPEMDGFEFISKYEEEFYNNYPKTKIIVLTNSILEKDKRKSSFFKCVFDFINKPLSEEDIIRIINNVNYFNNNLS